MNITKIAALYAQVSPSGRLCLPLAQLVLHNRRQPSTNGYSYRFDASCLAERGTYRDERGDRCAGFIDEHGSERVANWIMRQMPGYPEEILNLNPGATGNDQYLVSVWGYAGDNKDLKTTCMMRYGALDDFTIILRGMAAYQRKRRKQERKTIAQLYAYEQAKEQAKLRSGAWLGVEKALTTAHRVDEPGVPFMGDTSITQVQRQQLGLLYYAVYEQMDGMSASFPIGTGIALKPVMRSRDLVDGAVYVWQWVPEGIPPMTVFGRLDMSAKRRGFLPLRMDDNGKLADYCWAAWESETIKIYRVTHYTTRNGATLPLMQAETQPAQAASTKRQPKKQRELAHAA